MRFIRKPCMVCQALFSKETMVLWYRMREHVAAHILHGDIDTSVCGFCGQVGTCNSYMEKGSKRGYVTPVSDCPYFYRFYSRAISKSDRINCTNTPVLCSACHMPTYVWKYHMAEHWRTSHPDLLRRMELPLDYHVPDDEIEYVKGKLCRRPLKKRRVVVIDRPASASLAVQLPPLQQAPAQHAQQLQVQQRPPQQQQQLLVQQQLPRQPSLQQQPSLQRQHSVQRQLSLQQGQPQLPGQQHHSSSGDAESEVNSMSHEHGGAMPPALLDAYGSSTARQANGAESELRQPHQQQHVGHPMPPRAPARSSSNSGAANPAMFMVAPRMDQPDLPPVVATSHLPAHSSIGSLQPGSHVAAAALGVPAAGPSPSVSSGRPHASMQQAMQPLPVSLPDLHGAASEGVPGTGEASRSPCTALQQASTQSQQLHHSSGSPASLGRPPGSTQADDITRLASCSSNEAVHPPTTQAVVLPVRQSEELVPISYGQSLSLQPLPSLGLLNLPSLNLSSAGPSLDLSCMTALNELSTADPGLPNMLPSGPVGMSQPLHMSPAPGSSRDMAHEASGMQQGVPLNFLSESFPSPYGLSQDQQQQGSEHHIPHRLSIVHSASSPAAMQSTAAAAASAVAATNAAATAAGTYGHAYQPDATPCMASSPGHSLQHSLQHQMSGHHEDAMRRAMSVNDMSVHMTGTTPERGSCAQPSQGELHVGEEEDPLTAAFLQHEHDERHSTHSHGMMPLHHLPPLVHHHHTPQDQMHVDSSSHAHSAHMMQLNAYRTHDQHHLVRQGMPVTGSHGHLSSLSPSSDLELAPKDLLGPLSSMDSPHPHPLSSSMGVLQPRTVRRHVRSLSVNFPLSTDPSASMAPGSGSGHMMGMPMRDSMASSSHGHLQNMGTAPGLAHAHSLPHPHAHTHAHHVDVPGLGLNTSMPGMSASAAAVVAAAAAAAEHELEQQEQFNDFMNSLLSDLPAHEHMQEALPEPHTPAAQQQQQHNPHPLGPTTGQVVLPLESPRALPTVTGTGGLQVASSVPDAPLHTPSRSHHSHTSAAAASPGVVRSPSPRLQSSRGPLLNSSVVTSGAERGLGMLSPGAKSGLGMVAVASLAPLQPHDPAAMMCMGNGQSHMGGM